MKDPVLIHGETLCQLCSEAEDGQVIQISAFLESIHEDYRRAVVNYEDEVSKVLRMPRVWDFVSDAISSIAQYLYYEQVTISFNARMNKL